MLRTLLVRSSRRSLAVPLLGLFAALLLSPAPAHAAAGPVGTTISYPAGWNLVSFADSTSFTPNPALVGPLYTLDGSGSYTTADLAHVQPGVAYWAQFSDIATFTFLVSTQTSVDTTVQPGRCAMVGNPSSSASARVMGADRVYVYSALLNNYIAENLVGIGRGAWACNDSAAPEHVSVLDEGEVLSVGWPACCNPSSYAGSGNALLKFENDSPFPLTFAAPPIDGQGFQVDNNILVHGQLVACSSCVEYAPGTHTTCSPAAETRTVTVPPGRYLLHIQVDGPYVPDIQDVIDVQANTQYAICFFATTGRS